MTATSIDLPDRTASGSVPADLPLLDRRGWRAFRANPTGLVVGTVFAVLAMTPSLLPRGWLFQAVVSGISGAVGYGLGVAVAWLVRRDRAYERAAQRWGPAVPDRVRRWAWWMLLAAIPISVVVVLVIAADWQRQARELVGLPPETKPGWLRAAPAILLIAVLFVALWRGGRRAARWIAGQLRRRMHLPRRLAAVVGVAVVVLVTVGIVDGVVLRWALNTVDATFSVANATTPAGVTPPRAGERSGSPASLSSWETLGNQGQSFVTGGPTRAEMARAAGVPEARVLEPIRVYVGLEGGTTYEDRARLAVAELERTGAFDRAVLCVITSTGSGWVNDAAPSALELMYAGDTAVVATQYSYLPSWISFLVDAGRADRAGRTLFDAVHARVAQEPESERPRLLVYGESLGSAGSEAAFDGLGDLRDRVDGVLWTGPPHSNDLWQQLVERRDVDSPEVAPVYAEGLVVRFATEPEELTEPDGQWLEPRVAYLMHPTDPIVWWTPELLFARPDWLEEPRGAGVSPAMRWYPVVTFWQVTADMTYAQSPPEGYGHNYGSQLLGAWAVVAPPPGWTDEDTDRALAVVR